MKVLLVWPPMTVYGSDPTVGGANLPLGIGYIAAFLEKNNFEVKILDMLTLGLNNIKREDGKVRYGLSEEEISNRIEEFNPRIVGISAMFTAYYRDAHDVARIVKIINKDILVVLGGAHASINPETVLKDFNIDAIVVGEGEETFLDFAKRVEIGGDISNIPGTVVRHGNKIYRNKPRPFIVNLDSIPFFARHLLPMDAYLNTIKGSYKMRTPVVQMITSRGCPQQCTYCSIHSIWGHRWRPRSAKNVVDEIESVIKDYGAREILFLDDNMAVDSKRLEEICNEIINRRLDIKWATPNGISHWGLNKRLLKKMKQSGCYRLTFGIESGNIHTRMAIRKKFDLKQATEIIKYSNRIGLWSACTFILGFLCEDKQSIMDTINYAIKCDTDVALFFLLIPFPGTEVYEEFKRKGLLNFDAYLNPIENVTKDNLSVLGSVLAQSGFSTGIFTRDQLLELQNYAYRKFLRRRIISFLNPLRLLRKIHSLEDFTYIIKLCRTAILLGIQQKRSGSFRVQMFSRCNTSDTP